jgi:SAM-dependent methyltransferase
LLVLPADVMERTMAAGDAARWDARYRERGPEGRTPSPFLRGLDRELPRSGAALDVAGGAGRNALWLAHRGLDVTLVDVSPAALDLARAASAAAGLTLRLLVLDLEEAPLPSGPFALVAIIDFLHRPLFEHLPRVLAPGGLLVVSHPTRTNAERHAHPSARFLLEDGELPGLARDLEIVRFEEGWYDDRHEAHLLARRS